MLNWFLSLFAATPRTVDGAIAPLLKVFSDLEEVTAEIGREVARNEGEIIRLQAENNLASLETARAGKVLDALAAITHSAE